MVHVLGQEGINCMSIGLQRSPSSIIDQIKFEVCIEACQSWSVEASDLPSFNCKNWLIPHCIFAPR